MVGELILIFLFYVLAIFETSFSFYFTYPIAAIRTIFIVVFLGIFFDLKKDWLFPVAAGGFFLDVFSGGVFGLKTSVLILTVVFLKFLLSFIREESFLWFIPVFSASFLFYEFSASFFSCFLRIILNLFASKACQINYSISDIISSYSPWVSLIYNLFFATFGFFFVKYVFIPLKKTFKGRRSLVKLQD